MLLRYQENNSTVDNHTHSGNHAGMSDLCIQAWDKSRMRYFVDMQILHFLNIDSVLIVNCRLIKKIT